MVGAFRLVASLASRLARFAVADGSPLFLFYAPVQGRYILAVSAGTPINQIGEASAVAPKVAINVLGESAATIVYVNTDSEWSPLGTVPG